MSTLVTTPTNLVDLLTKVNGATFISINTSVEPRMLGGKKNPFKGRVRKIVEGSNVMVFQNKTTNAYKNMVERRLTKEGKDPASFKLSPRTWGERVPNTCFVKHKDKLYVEVIFLSKGKKHYTLDDEEATPVNLWRLNEGGEEGKQGGLNNKVIIRTFHIENITQITIDKHTYNNLIIDTNVTIPVPLSSL